MRTPTVTLPIIEYCSHVCFLVTLPLSSLSLSAVLLFASLSPCLYPPYPWVLFSCLGVCCQIGTFSLWSSQQLYALSAWCAAPTVVARPYMSSGPEVWHISICKLSPEYVEWSPMFFLSLILTRSIYMGERSIVGCFS